MMDYNSSFDRRKDSKQVIFHPVMTQVSADGQSRNFDMFSDEKT